MKINKHYSVLIYKCFFEKRLALIENLRIKFLSSLSTNPHSCCVIVLWKFLPLEIKDMTLVLYKLYY